jgi:hypothetical protein
MNKKMLSNLIKLISFNCLFLLLSASQARAQSININPRDEVNFTISELITWGINAVIIFAGLLAFIFLVWGGVQWLTSGGDKEKYEAARNRITAAIIGLVIIVAAWAIMNFIASIFGLSLTNLDFGKIKKSAGNGPPAVNKI